jgi:hypothetical protein
MYEYGLKIIVELLVNMQTRETRRPAENRFIKRIFLFVCSFLLIIRTIRRNPLPESEKLKNFLNDSNKTYPEMMI